MHVPGYDEITSLRLQPHIYYSVLIQNTFSKHDICHVELALFFTNEE